MKPGICPDRFTINLQLFGEKTEKPTAKRRQKARSQGALRRFGMSWRLQCQHGPSDLGFNSTP